MPDEVFDSWLIPLLTSKGWPFTSLDDNPHWYSSTWVYILAELPLQTWHDFRWNRIDIPFSYNFFLNETKERIEAIIGHSRGSKTMTANVESTMIRFDACADFFRTHGFIPGHIAGIAKKEGLELLDGHHRIAGAISVGIPAGFHFSIWIPFAPNDKTTI